MVLWTDGSAAGTTGRAKQDNLQFLVCGGFFCFFVLGGGGEMGDRCQSVASCSTNCGRMELLLSRLTNQ